MSEGFFSSRIIGEDFSDMMPDMSYGQRSRVAAGLGDFNLLAQTPEGDPESVEDDEARGLVGIDNLVGPDLSELGGDLEDGLDIDGETGALDLDDDDNTDETSKNDDKEPEGRGDNVTDDYAVDTREGIKVVIIPGNRQDEDDDAYPPEVASKVAGPSKDPMKDYLRQIGKVPLLNAEQEVELAKRIEAGVFAQEKLGGGESLDPALRKESDTTGMPVAW